jgi:hypothetical protein
MFKALGHGTQGKHFCFRHSLVGSLAIAQGAGKLRNLSDPAAVNLFLALNAEIHDQSPWNDDWNCNAPIHREGQKVLSPFWDGIDDTAVDAQGGVLTLLSGTALWSFIVSNRLTIGQQPQCIHHHDECRAFMEQHRDTNAGPAEQQLAVLGKPSSRVTVFDHGIAKCMDAPEDGRMVTCASSRTRLTLNCCGS